MPPEKLLAFFESQFLRFLICGEPGAGKTNGGGNFRRRVIRVHLHQDGNCFRVSFPIHARPSQVCIFLVVFRAAVISALPALSLAVSMGQ